MRTLIFLFLVLSVISCSVFDDTTSSSLVTDDESNLEQSVRNNVDFMVAGSSLLKQVNQQVISTLFQHPSLGFGTDADETSPRNNCPVITPEPGRLRIYPKEFVLDLDSEGSGCQPAGSTSKFQGKVYITVLSPVFLPEGHVIIETENLRMGDELEQEIEDLTMEHRYKENVDDNLVFDTKITRFGFNNTNSRLGQNESRRAKMAQYTGGITTYSDVLRDTDLNDLATIIDDLVTIEFESLSLDNTDTQSTLRDGNFQFSISCSCPVSGRYLDPSAGEVTIRDNSGCVDGLYSVRDRNYRLNCE